MGETGLKAVRPRSIDLFFLCLVSFSIRSLQVDIPSLYSDETIHMQIAQQLIPGQEKLPWLGGHPPLYFYLLSVVNLIGNGSIIASRMVTVLMGTLTVMLVYFLAHRLYGHKVAFLSGMLLAFLPPHVMLSRVVYLEVPMLLFITLGVYLLLDGLETNSTAKMTAASISLSVAMLIKATSIFPFLAILVWLILLRKRSLLRIALIAALPIAVFAGWNAYAALQGIGFFRAHGETYTILTYVRPSLTSFVYFKVLADRYLGLFLTLVFLFELISSSPITYARKHSLLLTSSVVPLLFALYSYSYMIFAGFTLILGMSAVAWLLSDLTRRRSDPSTALLYSWVLVVLALAGLLSLVEWRHLLLLSPPLTIIAAKRIHDRMATDGSSRIVLLTVTFSTLLLFGLQDVLVETRNFLKVNMLSFPTGFVFPNGLLFTVGTLIPVAVGLVLYATRHGPRRA